MGMAGELGNGVLKAFFVTKVSVSGIPSGHDVLSFIKVVPLSLFGFIFFGSTTIYKAQVGGNAREFLLSHDLGSSSVRCTGIYELIWAYSVLLSLQISLTTAVVSWIGLALVDVNQ